MSAVAAVVAVGCTSELPPRSFVQPNVIKKSDLTGTWYYLQTVTDAPPTNGAMFVGQSSSLMKIKFDIEEDYLYARRAYEQVEGSEDAAQLDPNGYAGEPLAAWSISSQFDIIRDYNSATGEQTNKIIESTERPWNEREFIRVDWSQQKVTDYVGIGVDLFFSDGVHVEPVSYWESDPTKPDALHLERNMLETNDPQNLDGFQKGEAFYLDITNQMIVTPDKFEFIFDGVPFTIPKCFLPYEDQYDCASQKVKLRHSFAKIGPNHDYEPRQWDGLQMNLFGVWDVGLRRLTYNRQYGITNSGVNRHAARFNIWQHSYGGTEGKDRIAPKDRVLRTIPYYAEGSQPVHYSGDDTWPDGMSDSIYPEELYPQFREIVGEWNAAMKVAAFDAMFGDNNGMGGTYQGKQIAKPEDLPDIFVPCHNPVRTSDWSYMGQPMKADPEACKSNIVPDMDAQGNVVNDKKGNPILHARQADPRRSNVFWVNQQQNSGPLGYGPPLYDPVTGETISGQAYIYGAALDTYAARARDLMLLQNGEFDPTDFVAGANVQDWVNQHRFGVANRPTTYSQTEVSTMAKAMDFDWAKGMSPEYGYPQIDVSSIPALKQSINNRQEKIFQGYFSQQVTGARESKLNRIVGTPIEKAMVTPELMAASGVSPMKQWDQLSPLEKAMTSPIRSKQIQDAFDAERLKAETIGLDFAAFDDPGLSQRLQRFLDKYNGDALTPHAEEIRQQLRKDIFLAVALHEVGHNMGLRHNFRASYDAMNYFPDYKDPTDGKMRDGYWHIRTDAVGNPDVGMQPAQGLCVSGPSQGKACMADGECKNSSCSMLHPRYVNRPGGAVTQYEMQKGIRETQYSSIMDYGAEFNSDLLGLGMYDRAHLKFSYAEYVEVFTDNKTDPDSLLRLASMHQFQTALGFPSPLTATSGLGAIAYQTIPNLFNSGYQGIYMRQDVPYSSLITDANGLISDPQGHPLVPYYFCSDEFAGNLTCQRFDAGADAYEQVTDWASRYENFYLYNNFKRDRQAFWSNRSYIGRISGRYFTPMREQLTWYVLLRSDFENFLATNAGLGSGDPNNVVTNENQFFTDELGWGNFTVAVTTGFETLGKAITTPTAGYFYAANTPDGGKLWTQFRDDTTPVNAQNVRVVPYIDGKYTNTIWDFNGCGYYWADECQLRIGYMLDKQIALDVLSQSQAYFTGRDTTADVRQYAIGYIIPFKKQIEEKFGAIFSGDMTSIAPYFKRVQGDFAAVQPSWALDDPTLAKGTDMIDPSMGFTVQLYAGVYGLASFPTTFDHDFLDTTKVFVVGNGEASTPDSTILAQGTTDPKQLVANGGNKEWFYVTDPSGKIFAAHSTPSKPINVLDVSGAPGNQYQTKTVALRDDQGVRMLEHLGVLASQLAAAKALPDNDPSKVTAVAFQQNEYDKFRENIEVMRSLQNAFGYGAYKSDANFYY